MFKLNGLKENIENVFCLTKSHLKGALNKHTIKSSYRDFLQKIQPNVPQPYHPEPSFLWKKKDVTKLLEIFQEESLLDDFVEVFDNTQNQENESIARIKKACSKMEDINVNFAELLDLVIHTIFSSPSKLAGGGSTSSAIGCIWVNLRSHWNQQDILEFLIHETTHNLVFIDELCHTHYTNYSDLVKNENYAFSAILNKMRPLDKVFHSIIVSSEILHFREDHLGHPESPALHPPSDILFKQISNSISSIVENTSVYKLLSERAKEMLFKCTEKLQTIKLKETCAI